MARFKLAFGIHNHQPVGNFSAVFDDAHHKAYLPFLELLAEHPSIRISFHQSGILWDWQKASHPEFFQLVGSLVDKGQVELMTGGFYEPILISIPRGDAIGQIAMLDEFLKDHFGVETKGLWLTERIWEPHLPKLLSDAGIAYLPVDDTHFLYAGLEQSQLTGPFVTESEGFSVTLLPIQKRLRYLIPFGTVEEVIAELKSQAEQRPGGFAVYADDGEKFGVWPGTHEHCYRDGWLRDFFKAVEENSDWLEIVPLEEAAAERVVGRAYLPSASYEEMLHWALPPTAYLEYEAFEEWLKSCGKSQQYGRFVRGGHWRGFLSKYEESNLMHKKMLRISHQLTELESKPDVDRDGLMAARRHVYASQCNCAYWHGVFGGLYLPHLRQGVYRHMVQAARKIRELAGSDKPTLQLADYDGDNQLEVIFESGPISAVLKPDRGGTLLELCLNEHDFNVTDTLTRRREGYHLRLDQAVLGTGSDGHSSIHDLVLAKEEGLKSHLVDDWYLKRCFIDHFFADDVDQARFMKSRFREEGDFILEPYAVDLDESRMTATMFREGFVRRPDGEFPVRIQKRFRFGEAGTALSVEYVLSSDHPGGVEVEFAVENSLNFQAGHAVDRFVTVDGRPAKEPFLDAVGSYTRVNRFGLVDEYHQVAVAIDSSLPADIWQMPIFTVSQSEGGFERVYQGTTLVHRFKLALQARPIRLRFDLKAGSLTDVAANSATAANTAGR
jgi:alpha-amylase